MRASLVIPTLNEASSIGHVLTSFRAAADEANQTYLSRTPLDWEVLVVDGASTDGTETIARAGGARVIKELRKGYGRAYKSGFAAATGEVLATVDGDATYPVEDVPRLVGHLFDHDLDFVTCNRLAHIDRKAMTTEHRIGNRVLNFFLSIAYHRFLQATPAGKLVDSQSGMWIFRRSVLDRVKLTQDGMPFSEEFKIEVLLRGLRFEEVPIRYAERWGAPKLSSWRDGRENLMFLVRKRFEVAREPRLPGRVSLPKPREQPAR